MDLFAKNSGKEVKAVGITACQKHLMGNEVYLKKCLNKCMVP